MGVPVGLFLACELVLRLTGYGRASDFFIPDEQPGVYRTNPHYTELFFPASFGLKPVNFRLPRAKPDRELRVFVIGESAAMGVPEPGFGVAPQLRAQLASAYPQRDVAVYNLAVTAINSHAIVPIVEQAVEFRPDVLVVYMGNNEVVGPFGPGSVATSQMPPRVVIRASLWLRGTRTGQLLQRVIQKLGASGASFKDWRGMEMFADKAVTANDPRLERVYANFSANMRQIISAARDAGVKVVLSTVAVNLRDCAPFASRHADTLTAEATANFEREMQRGEYERALAIDPAHADAHFLFARKLAAKGEDVAAHAEFLAALHWDALRFRADRRINEIIREIGGAAASDVVLVEAVDHGADAGSVPAELVDGDYFFEHVHFTWRGNFALARRLARGVAQIIPGQQGPWRSEAECAAALGFTEFGRASMAMSMERLTGRPPFTNQLSFAEDRARLHREIGAANAAVSVPGALRKMAVDIERARRGNPTEPFLFLHEATIRAELGEYAHALELNAQLATLQPPSPEQVAQRAYFLQQMQRFDEGEALLRQSAENEPYYFQTYTVLSRLWATSGQHTRAVAYFGDVVQRMGESLAVRNAYAQALAAAGEWSRAEKEWRTILRATPDDEAALEPLCAWLFQRGAPEAALELMHAAHRHNPRSYANNARLVQIHEQRRDREQTVAFMRDLAASGPVTAALHMNRASLLRELGRIEEALAELQQAQAVAQADGDAAALATIREIMQRTQPVTR